MFCANCGKQIEGNFCPQCGKSVAQISDAIPSNEVDQALRADSDILAIKEFTISAGALAINRERQIISKVNVGNGQITVTNYFKTSQRPPNTVTTFGKGDIISIDFKRIPLIRTIEKIRYVIAGLMVASVYITAEGFILGLMLAAFNYLFSLNTTMIIQLKTGEKVKIIYAVKADTDELYNYLKS